jgi:hypothetical protein
VLPQFGMRGRVYANFSRCKLFMQIVYRLSSAIRGEHHSRCILVVRTEMQYVLYQRKIDLRTRSMSHLLSSVNPVMYCEPTHHTPIVSSLAPSAASCFSVCFFGWAIADYALHRLASQSGAHSLFVHCCSSCVVCSLHSSCFTRALIFSKFW